MKLDIEVQTATFDQATVTVTTDTRRPINRLAIRTLILQEVADRLGLSVTLTELYNATGYNARENEQWVMQSVETPDGGRVMTYTVTVPTPEQKEAKLRREGGLIPFADGSYGFVMPQPRN